MCELLTAALVLFAALAMPNFMALQYGWFGLFGAYALTVFLIVQVAHYLERYVYNRR